MRWYKKVLAVCSFCTLLTTVKCLAVSDIDMNFNEDKSIYYKNYEITEEEKTDIENILEKQIEIDGNVYELSDYIFYGGDIEHTIDINTTKTIISKTNNKESIIEQLGNSLEYEEKGFKGEYILDQNSIKIKTNYNGYKEELIEENIEYKNLEKNDLSYIPKEVEKDGKKCFKLTNISETTVPSGIERIENGTFANCRNLSKVILSEGLKTIGDFAFQYDNILEITIPSTVETIGKSVFYNNMNLTKIEINKKEGKEANFIYEEGILMPKDKSEILFIANAYLKSTNEFEIPSGIKNFNISIMDFTNITKIIIPASLTSGLNAEYFPWSIESIEIEEGNTKYIVSDIDKILYTQDTKEIISCYSKEKIINLKENELGLLKTGNYSFRQAKNVETVTLPDSLEKIGPRTFTNCNNIKEINIGENVNNIDGLFKYKNYSGIVNISKKNNSYIVKNNILYTKAEPKTLVVVLNQINGGFSIDSSVKVIGNVAFYEQKLMTNVIIPNSVIEIKNSFGGCIGLKSIEIPGSVESIGENCFVDCSNLEKVTIYNEKLLETAPWGAVKGDKVIDFKG